MVKTALVTGGTSGIGKELVDNLTMDGYFVYVISRSKSKEELLNIFPHNYNSIKHIAVDFGVINEIKKVINYISTINKIDVFILNHGVSKDTNNKNEGKYNSLFLVNTISIILFTNGIIKRFPNSRYIFISSILSSIIPYCLFKIDFNKYFKNENSDLIEYGLSKYCLNLFSRYLYEYYDIDCISLDPGFLPNEGMNKATGEKSLKIKKLLFKTGNIDQSINRIKLYCNVQKKLDGSFIKYNGEIKNSYSDFNKISLIKSIIEICSDEKLVCNFTINSQDEGIFKKIKDTNAILQTTFSLYPIIIYLITIYYLSKGKMNIKFLVYFFVTSELLKILKKFLKYKRPINSYNSDNYLIYNKKDKTYGMPSLHAYTSFLFSTVVLLNKGIDDNHKKVILCIGLIVSISRIYYNNHTTYQVIVGSLLGIIMGITYSKYKGIKININSIIILFIILLFMGCKSIYKVVLHNNECKKNNIPDIFIDEEMKYDIEKKFNDKLLKNTNYYDYWFPAIWKSFHPSNSNLKITWDEIDFRLNNHNIPKDELKNIDTLVGIFSGGGFIVKRFGNILSKDVTYIESKYWTDQNLDELLKKTVDMVIDKNILTKNAKSKIIVEYTDIEKIKGKNILLVDDTCFTGKTLNTTKQHIYSLGAKTVKTYCLYNCPKGDFNSVDYHSGILDKIPLYWPWGYELN